MSEEFYDKIDNISNKEPSKLIEAMKDPNNILKYYGFLIKEEKVKIKLRTAKGGELDYEGGELDYDINIKDPLILLRFYYRANNAGAKSGNWDKMKLYLIEEDGNVIKKVEPTDTIESLKSGTSLAQDQQLYFSFKTPEMVEAQKQKGGNKRKRKKKKKAFPSRKKNNRKNRTKKKTLSK